MFLPVDLPLLPSALIRYLLFHASITGAAVTLISLNGFPQTFPVVLAASVLDVWKDNSPAGSSGCYNAFAAASRERGESIAVLPLEYLVQSGAVLHPDCAACIPMVLECERTGGPGEPSTRVTSLRPPKLHRPSLG